MYFQGHQAENDCLALLELLNQRLPGTERTMFQEILAQARVSATRVYAIDAPYDKRDQLQALGFRWQARHPKAYYRDVSGELGPIKARLQEDIYPYPLTDNMLGYARVNAMNRHSNRIAPEPTYLRHLWPFGKYKGMTIQRLAEQDPDYLRWALDKMEHLDVDLRRTLHFYLNQEQGPAAQGTRKSGAGSGLSQGETRRYETLCAVQ